MGKPVYVSEDNRLPIILLRTILKILRGISVLFLLTLVLALITFVYRVYPRVVQARSESYEIAIKAEVKDFRTRETSYVYNSDGGVLLKLWEDKDVRYVTYSELPKKVIDAFIAIEDKRFYEHKGVDWKSTGKAAWLLIKNKGDIVRGGSTITQQLARNVYLSFETSYERKIREIFLALALEERFSKEQILEFYVNNINFGNNYCGIGAASIGYFGKQVDDLTLAEIAFLCAIPNNPTLYDPRENYQNTKKRQSVILREMYEQDKVSVSEYTAACSEEINVLDAVEYDTGYAASYALNCAVEELMRINGFEEKYSWDDMDSYNSYLQHYNEMYGKALHSLKTGGYVVKTSLSQNTQQSLQQIFTEQLAVFEEVSENGDFVIQGGATVIDNTTQKVVAVIGGREDNGSLGLNRAFQSYKQPGSTIKPLIVYTPAFSCGYNANSSVLDAPIENGPENSNGIYNGKITLREAVEQSKNVVAWRIFEELTPVVGLSYLKDMHFSKVVPNDYCPAASLGGLTYGVTTVEMCGGYATLANKGLWTKPTCITSIQSTNGTELYHDYEQQRIYSQMAANSMTDILMGVGKRGTASGLRLEGDHDFACKTGTTNNNKAAWFCGYTKQYTIAVYVGADDNNVAVKGLWGSTYPAYVWKEFQDFLLQGQQKQDLLSQDELYSIERNSTFNFYDTFMDDVSIHNEHAVSVFGDIVETQDESQMIQP